MLKCLREPQPMLCIETRGSGFVGRENTLVGFPKELK